MATSMRESGFASARWSRAWRSSNRSSQGGIRVPVTGTGRAGEGLALVEGFRGDVLAWVRLDAEARVERCHLRDPSWFQWPVLEAAIENNIVADFPLCYKSFNCSYSGHDLEPDAMRKILFKSLLKKPLTEPAPQLDDPEIVELAQKIDHAARVKLGHGLSIREIDAGSCNGCELEIHALGNAFYHLE
jgi:hypothetical protein